MNPFVSDFANHPLVLPLAGSLLHSLWQIALIAGVAICALKTCSSLTASDRYLVLLTAMMAIPVAFLITLGNLMQHKSGSPTTAFLTLIHSSPLPSETISNVPSNLLLGIVSVWIAGMGAISLRAAGGFILVHRLKKHLSEPVLPHHIAQLRSMCHRIGLNQVPDLRQTTRQISPAIWGFIRPVIIVPAGFFAHLAPEHVEAILLHELAHLKRRDYLVNLLQHMVEIVFFYHPCTWWVSSALRNERETCCDDIVVNTTGDALSYARALLNLGSQMRAPALAMPVTGSTHKLYHRIKHILEDNSMNTKSTGRLFAVLAIITGLCLTAGISGNLINAETADTQKKATVVKIVEGEAIVENLTDGQSLDEILATLDIDLATIDAEVEASDVKIIRLDEDKDALDLDAILADLNLDLADLDIVDLSSEQPDNALCITMENGEITAIKDNGQEVPESEFSQYEDRIPDLNILQLDDSSAVKTIQILHHGDDNDADDSAPRVIKKVIKVNTDDSGETGTD